MVALLHHAEQQLWLVHLPRLLPQLPTAVQDLRHLQAATEFQPADDTNDDHSCCFWSLQDLRNLQQWLLINSDQRMLTGPKHKYPSSLSLPYMTCSQTI